MKSFLLLSAVALSMLVTGCQSTSSTSSHGSSDDRPFNPQTNRFESKTPAQTPTSAGSSTTSSGGYQAR